MSRHRGTCGSRHPRYPDLRCQRLGRCAIDWHTGVIENEDGQAETVDWGVLAEKLSDGAVRVVPIYEVEA